MDRGRLVLSSRIQARSLSAVIDMTHNFIHGYVVSFPNFLQTPVSNYRNCMCMSMRSSGSRCHIFK